MLFQAPPEEPVETERPRATKPAGDRAAPRGGGEQLFTPPATDPPADATPAKAPRPRKKAVAEPAAVEPAVAEQPAKKAAPKKAAAVKRTPAARTADQPADAVKDPAPAETTTPKIPARRKAVAAAPADESQAKATKKAAPKKTAARKPTTQKAASDVAQALAPDPGPTEEPVSLSNEAADSVSIAQRTDPVAETPAAAATGVESTATEQAVEAVAGTSDLAPIDEGTSREPVIATPATAAAKPGAGSLWRLPETAAAAAVRRFTPQADTWAREIRATYPTATPDGIARLAQQKFLRKTTAAGVAASLANGWSSVADIAATSWVNAELIAHIAAAYGRQATAADVLVLTGVHQDHESAQAAIDGTPGHSASRAPITAAGKTATWAALKILGRWWPGLAAAGGAATATLNTERVAARAIQRFRAS
jgi:hypothetical protein